MLAKFVFLGNEGKGGEKEPGRSCQKIYTMGKIHY